MELASTKPYLLRALYEWCVDQGFTPHIAVRVDANTVVPRQFVQDGQIVLNIGADAVNDLQMGNEVITCRARFGGVAQGLSVPVDNVAAIYARENGQGLSFEVTTATQQDGPVAAPAPPPEGPPPEEPEPPRSSHLKRIK